MNMSSRISPRTLAFLGLAALLLILGAVMSVRSQASVAATVVSAPLSVNVAAEPDYAARRSASIRAANAAAAGHDYAANWVAEMRESFAANQLAANLERSNAAAAARDAEMAQSYAHGRLMPAKPAIGDGSATSELAPTGKYPAASTAPSKKHVPGGGP